MSEQPWLPLEFIGPTQPYKPERKFIEQPVIFSGPNLTIYQPRRVSDVHIKPHEYA
jgi:hypothetical protein